MCKKLEESRVTRGIGGCKHSSNFSNRHTPDCTNSIEKHYSDYLYCRQQLPHHQTYCSALGCSSNPLNRKQPVLVSAHSKQSTKQSNQLTKSAKDDTDDVFHENDQLADEESLLKMEMTGYFLKNNYNLILDRLEDGSRLVCKCGIATMLPKSLLFFDPYLTNDTTKLPDKIANDSPKEPSNESSKETAFKERTRDEQTHKSNGELDANEDVFASDQTDEQQPSKSLISRMLNSFLGKENLFLGRKECKVDKNEKKCDCQLNANEMSKQDELNADLFFKQHAERLHQQLIKSKQRLDSISSENFSSRSDSWRQQASQQLKMIEKYFHDKVKHPGLIRYDFRKNSGTTGSCSTSTFRISSVSSDNFKPFDHRYLAGDRKGLSDDEDLRKHLFENRCNEKLVKNQIDSEILSNLFKQFLCSDCKVIYKHTNGKEKVSVKQKDAKLLKDLKDPANDAETDDLDENDSNDQFRSGKKLNELKQIERCQKEGDK